MAFDERAINREVERVDREIFRRGVERGARTGEAARGGSAIEAILTGMSMDRPEIAMQTAGALSAEGARAANLAQLRNAARTEEELQSRDRLAPMRKAEARELRKIRRSERKSAERAKKALGVHRVLADIGSIALMALPGGAAVGQLAGQLHKGIAGEAIGGWLGKQQHSTGGRRERLSKTVADYELPGLGQYSAALKRAYGTGFEGYVVPTYGQQQTRRPRRPGFEVEEEVSVAEQFGGGLGGGGE